MLENGGSEFYGSSSRRMLFGLADTGYEQGYESI